MVYIEFNNGCEHLKLNYLLMTLLKHKLDQLANFILPQPKFKMAGKINICQVIIEKGSLKSNKL